MPQPHGLTKPHLSKRPWRPWIDCQNHFPSYNYYILVLGSPPGKVKDDPRCHAPQHQTTRLPQGNPPTSRACCQNGNVAAGPGFLSDGASLSACNCKGVWPVAEVPVRTGKPASASEPGCRPPQSCKMAVPWRAVLGNRESPPTGSISKIVSLLPNVPAVVHRHSQPATIADCFMG